MRAYFDHNATTPVSAEALAVSLEVLAAPPGNPSSIHTDGQRARQRVEQARSQVAALLGCEPKEIVFTSGGTEADNLALLGAMRPAAGKHLIVSTIEHPAVLAAADQLEREGAEVSRVHPDAVADAIQPNTVLISVMHANNETGSIQQFIGTAHPPGILVHSDGVQAAGRLSVNVKELGVDLYSISGHKLNAPKGVGALYIRDGVKLNPQSFGGRHERGRRAGTENVAGIAAFGAACDWLLRNRDIESRRLGALRDRFERRLLATVPDVRINAGNGPRIPNTSNVSIAGVDGEAMVIALDLAGFAVSTGAACSSGAVAPSHVLLAIGLTASEARGSLRVSMGQGNTEAEVDALVEAIAASAARLRRLSPVYSHA